MTWISGACLPIEATAMRAVELRRARLDAMAEAVRWHRASITAGHLHMATEAPAWWVVFAGMTWLAADWLNRYERLLAASQAYGVRHAH